MTREEAAQILDDAWSGRDNNGSINVAYKMAITALRGPIPDPVTGLVPCGCGKPAKWFTWDMDDGGNFHAAGCSGDCPATTDWQESQDDARKIWNKMMGYKEEE